MREAQEQAAIDAEADRQRLEAATQAAERRATEAAAQAQRDAEAAVERERQRVADAEAAEAAAQAKREANKKHVAKVNAEVVEALMGHAALTKIEATAVLAALNANAIPHVTIAY